MGGADDPAPYWDLDAMDPEEHMDLDTYSGLWDVNDSLRHIPSYDIYCHWNTASIFHAPGANVRLDDTLTLNLSNRAADHYMPVCGHVTSPYGPRRGRMHYGVDLKLDHGDPVVSAFAGKVRISRYHRTFGNVVVVRHHNGLETLYAHLSRRSVETGDDVQAGEVLGLGGSTGRSTGNHLHFEVRYLDQPIDPQLLFDVEDGELYSRDLHLHQGIFDALAADRAAVNERKFHTVRQGDTLSAIARRYGTSVPVLTRLNGISAKSTLRIGQRVRYR